jgi:WD40 repeat protein/beta-lactamase regulating signal transducer with metallopeptidase domain
MNSTGMMWFFLWCALVRTTIWLTAAALIVQMLIWIVRPVSPRTYRIAWACVLISGILFGRVPINIPSTIETAGAIAESPVEPAPRPSATSIPLPTEPMSVSAPPGSRSRVPVPVVRYRIENEISPAPIPVTMIVPVFHFTWYETALVIWGLGIAVILSVGIFRYVRFASHIARLDRAPNEPEQGHEWRQEWCVALDQRNCGRRIPLVVSESAGPALCLALSGYRVIVPRPLWESLSAAKRISILRHELAHYERGDLYNSLFALLIVAMHWFNPCAWWARRQFDAAGEWACDDAAARTCDEIEFAKTLMQLAGVRFPAIPLTDAVGAGPLYPRIRRLLTASSAADARWKRYVIAAVAVGLVGLASIRVSRVAEATAPPPSAPKIGPSHVDRFGDPLPEGAVMRLGTMRLRQYGVERTAFLPDGETIASMAFTGTFRLWDRKTGRLIQSFQDSVGDYTSGRQFALSPDGAKLVSVGRFFENKVAKLRNENKSSRRAFDENGYVCLWDTRNGKKIWSQTVPGRGNFGAVAFSPDGTIIAAGGVPYTLFDVASGKELRRYGKVEVQSPPRSLRWSLRGGYSVVVFSPDGRTLITFDEQRDPSPDRSRNGVIRLWDVHTGNLSGSISIPGELKIESLFTSLDGKQIIAGGFRRVPAAKFPRPIVARDALVPEICYWDLKTGRLARTYRFEDTTFGTGAISLSKDQKMIAWSVGDRICIWDAVAGKSLRQIPHALSVAAPSLSPDGTVVAAGHVNEVAEWDTTTGRRLPVDLGDFVTSLTAAKFSPDGRTIYTGASDGRLTAWDATTGAIRFQKTHGPLPSISSLDVSVDGQWVATCGTKEKLPKGGNLYAAVLWDARTGEPVRDYYDHDRPLFAQGVAISPDSRFLALAGKRLGNEVVTQIWDVKTGNKMAEIHPAEEELGPRGMRFSTDSKSLITLNTNSYLRRWNAMTGTLEKEFFADRSPANPERTHWINGAAIAPDYRTAVSSEKSAIYTWNLDSGQLVSEIRMPKPGKERWCGQLAISADARLLAAIEVVSTTGPSGAMNQITGSIIRIYDRANGRELQKIETEDVQAAGLDFSPDANRLAAVMNDGTALVWDLSPAQRRLHQ